MLSAHVGIASQRQLQHVPTAYEENDFEINAYQLQVHLYASLLPINVEIHVARQQIDGWLRMGLLPPPPKEFCRHILSCRELKAESFKRCLHSVLRGVSL